MTSAYGYDHSGNRVSDTVNSGTPTTYLLDTNNPSGYVQVLEERQGSGLTATCWDAAGSRHRTLGVCLKAPFKQ